MKDDTLMVHTGRDSERHFGIVNTPVYRASTVLYPTIDDFNKRIERKYRGVTYGASGTPTTLALADAVCRLEGGQGTVVVSTGLAAITMSLAAFVKAGDHLLVPDSVYGPTRRYCDSVLSRFGVTTTYYDPCIGSRIDGLFRADTRLVFVESPGSLTFEVQDIPAIAEVARRHDALVLADNTWGTPLFFKSFDHGVDVSIQAGTKYIGGHSDLVIGMITARSEELFRQIKDTTGNFGDIAGPDVCYLALRGLRSMGVRLRRHQASGLQIARWMQDRPEVKRVMYPPLPEDPGHRLWKRDFSGACSLFGVVFHTASEKAIAQMVNGYRLFKLGASWGGYESLVIPANPRPGRTAVPWTESGYVLRYHVGLEDPEDLLEDLGDGFERLNTAVKEGI
jgi:cystathionine beta-lyase